MKPVSFFSALLVFCAMVTSAHAEDTKIAVLLKSTTHPYWKIVYDSIEENAAQNDIDIILQATNRPNDVEGQLNICETIFLHKPSALIVATVNPYNLTPCLKKFNTQNIPVIDVDGNLTEEIAEETGVEVAFSVGSNNYEIGKYAAEYLKDAKGKLLLLEGLPGSPPSIFRTSGFMDNKPEGIEVVASLPTDWDRIKGTTITTDVVTQHPDIKYIYAVSDAQGIGAVEALKAMQREDVIVVGVDGQPDAVKSIREGGMDASIAQLPYLMGKEAIIKTKTYLENKDTPVEFYQYVPIVTLTKELLEKEEEPLLEYVR